MPKLTLYGVENLLYLSLLFITTVIFYRLIAYLVFY